MPIVGPITADFVSNATTASNESVTGMSFPVASGRMYKFRFHVLLTVAATTTGVELAVDTPALTIGAWGSHVPTTTTAITFATGTDDAGGVNTDTAVAAGTFATVEGFARPSADGAIALRIDTDAAFAATVKAGSFIEYRDCGV